MGKRVIGFVARYCVCGIYLEQLDWEQEIEENGLLSLRLFASVSKRKGKLGLCVGQSKSKTPSACNNPFPHPAPQSLPDMPSAHAFICLNTVCDSAYRYVAAMITFVHFGSCNPMSSNPLN